MDLGIQDQDGFTAADLAEYNGHEQCAKYLRTVENMVRNSSFTVFGLSSFSKQNPLHSTNHDIHLKDIQITRNTRNASNTRKAETLQLNRTDLVIKLQ